MNAQIDLEIISISYLYRCKILMDDAKIVLMDSPNSQIQRKTYSDEYNARIAIFYDILGRAQHFLAQLV